MDTSDHEISFDAEGRCNHCRSFDAQIGVSWFPNAEGAERLERQVAAIKSAGKGKEYDCVIGLSGGIDSSYLMLCAKDWGLRPLVVHVDAGWNSELAVQNIERLVKETGYELHTRVINWEDMRRLHLAYLRAGVANQDVPQDHAFFAGLYHFTAKHKVKHVINGGNMATEGIFPQSWHGAAMDSRNLKAINAAFGDGKLSDYPTINMFQYYVWYPFALKVTPFRPLNLMAYNKDEAIARLETVGWRTYPRKHGESLFTRWFQNHYLPEKFGYDKRLPHYSSLIASGGMTREEALARLEEPLYDPQELKRDTAYISRKLRISPEELEGFISGPGRDANEFANWQKRYESLKAIQRRVSKITGRRLSIYS